MTMHRREFVKASIAGAAALSVGRYVWPRRADAANAIPVGAIYDLSGPLQLFGQNQWLCAKMAIDEINESGGLLGRKLEV